MGRAPATVTHRPMTLITKECALTPETFSAQYNREVQAICQRLRGLVVAVLPDMHEVVLLGDVRSTGVMKDSIRRHAEARSAGP